MNDVASMTGADAYKKAPEGYRANEVRLNGETGEFQYVDLLGKKQGQKAEVRDLGQSIRVAFLKVRRKLGYYDGKTRRMIQTAEHNHKDDQTFLFGPNVKGKASELREQFEKLRTIQVVYALLSNGTDTPEVVKLIVKGASLGSENKAESTTDFYAYLQSFEEGEHAHEFVTNLKAVQESGAKDYWCIDFKRGAKLPEDKMALSSEKIREIHEATTAQDRYYNVKSETEVREETNDIQIDDNYPDAATEGINPEDIPF